MGLIFFLKYLILIREWFKESQSEIPEFINVLKVSDIEANSDFKIRSPNKGIFNTKLSTNFLPDWLE